MILAKHIPLRITIFCLQCHDNSRSSNRGQLKVSLQFNITDTTKQKGNLEVTIVSAHGLLQSEVTCNPVVKW